MKTAYNWVFYPQFYRGACAELAFEEICTTHKLVWQKITQDKISFEKQKAAGFANAKRGDYLIRSLRNFEVEVKCYKVQKEGEIPGFFLDWKHIARHNNNAAMTRTPIFFAFFEPAGKRSINPHSLRMIRLDILRESKKRPKGVVYKEAYKSLFIPLDALTPGLIALDQS